VEETPSETVVPTESSPVATLEANQAEEKKSEEPTAVPTRELVPAEAGFTPAESK
jgi:hypothetical protein